MIELKRLLVDVDDVAAQFRPKFMQLCNELLGMSKTLEDGATIYDCNEAFGLSQEQEDLIYTVISQPDFALSLELMPGVGDAIEELQHKYEVIFVTAPLKNSKTWAHDRRAWIRKHFGQVLEESSISTSSKHMIDGDYLIEDKLENAKAWKADRLSRCNGHRYVAPLLYAWPYNINDEGITYLKSWKDIVRYLECP